MAADDLRPALRSLRTRPGFFITAVLTLRLGIGAVAAIFTVYDAMLLKPLPFVNADRVVYIAREQPPNTPSSIRRSRNGAIAAARSSMRWAPSWSMRDEQEATPASMGAPAGAVLFLPRQRAKTSRLPALPHFIVVRDAFVLLWERRKPRCFQWRL